MRPGSQEATILLPNNLISDYIKNGCFEQNLIDWTKEFCSPERTTLDIGAHTGTYALQLAPYSSDVEAFEPQRMTFYGLCGGVALSQQKNIFCHHCALGDKEQASKEWLDLHIVSEDGGGSSICHQENDKSVLDIEKVRVKTLDSFGWEEKGIGFIKIDVEGNEPAVIRGGKETLRGNHYPRILFEANSPDEWNKVNEECIALEYRVMPIRGYFNMFLAHRD
jgi:FkbM family methyltransferase